VVHDAGRFSCKACSTSFPVVDGIPDFYPEDNPFSPRLFNLKDKYEDFGQDTVRPDSFQNIRRRRLTTELVEGRDALELGAAEGWMTRELVGRAGNVVSSDISLNYLKRARQDAPQADFLRLDAHCLPFMDSSFDCVIITEVLEHVYCPYRVLEEVHRVLRPDGKLVLSVPNNLSSSNILRHLVNRPGRQMDAHLSFYDMFSLEQLFGFVGFAVEKSCTAFVYLPVLKPLFRSNGLQKFLQKIAKNFGDKIVVRARKTGESRWQEL
jgi:ubiquinone/menaquinone biosynthesis C-methylase UbiE